MNVLYSLHDSFPDQLLCSKFYQTHMFLKELMQLIHEIVTQVLLVANTDASPKVVDQTPSDEMTGHVNGNSHSRSFVTIPAITPTFSSPSRPAASPEVPRDTSSSHVPLGLHVIHLRAPSSRPMPRNPVSRPHWVRLRESPPSTPDAPNEPESSTDPRIDSAAMTEDLSILQGLLSRLPMSLWSAVPDITDTDGH